MNLIFDYFADWWMQRCPHDGSHVLADLLEGAWDAAEVKYCRRCGAVRLAYHGGSARDWRRPRPLWHSDKQP